MKDCLSAVNPSRWRRQTERRKRREIEVIHGELRAEEGESGKTLKKQRGVSSKLQTVFILFRCVWFWAASYVVKCTGTLWVLEEMLPVSLLDLGDTVDTFQLYFWNVELKKLLMVYTMKTNKKQEAQLWNYIFTDKQFKIFEVENLMSMQCLTCCR